MLDILVAPQGPGKLPSVMPDVCVCSDAWGSENTPGFTVSHRETNHCNSQNTDIQVILCF